MRFESNQEYLGELLESLKPVAIQIAEMFGKDCEVVIHDFSRPKNSVVFVVNGHVTGRSLGQPFNDLMQILRSPLLKNDQLSNYYKTTKDGKTLKSSTALIKDKNGDIVGALCVNLDLRRMMEAQGFLSEMCKTISFSDEAEIPMQNGSESHSFDNLDIHSEGVNRIMSSIISKVIADMQVPVNMMSREMKIEIVSFLYDKEVFSIKGAVEELAKQLGMSKYSVYNYIDAVKMRTDGGYENGNEVHTTPL